MGRSNVPSVASQMTGSAVWERPRHECLFPPLGDSPSRLSPQLPPVDEGLRSSRGEGLGSVLSRSEPALCQPPQSVLSAVSTSFVPVAPPTSSVVKSQPPEVEESPLLKRAAREQEPQSPAPALTSKVGATLANDQSKSGRMRSGAAAAMLPYAASEVSSAQSGWRHMYWKQPSVNFSRGLLSQDVRYSNECSHQKCVVQETKFPPLPRQAPQEIHNKHRIAWLSSMIRKEEEGLARPRRSMSEVNANIFTDKQLDHHPWSHQWLPAKAANAAKKAAAVAAAAAAHA
eukprot:TRINITY_DN54239_c0_g1_i1.p1 TRINITY_DN54239_c0_g1~~TRINITY_DN54239_c0_g1_i1.p1  ORF type:complete len:298 (+),score=49.98 TRINITY_DN54239_c0_g1_i1:36-896(+)